MKSPARIGLLMLLALWPASPAQAQQVKTAPGSAPAPGQALPGEDEDKTESAAAQRFRALTDPEALEKKEKERSKPPFEFYRSQVAPFDILPFVKAGHWNTLSLELKANYSDYAGLLQTSPVMLLDMPHAMVFRRDARLQKGQDARLSLQLMLPRPTKEVLVELTRPEAIRADAGWQASFLRLEPHQMLVPILSPEPSAYNGWASLNATLPSSGDKDLQALDRQRYYKLVLPLKPDKPQLSAHPLTWTTISHILWDGQEPESLSVGQQRAMIDWLHFGGQIVVVAVGAKVAALQDSFLGPYLPATLSGTNPTLLEQDLAPMAEAYPPPLWPGEWEEAVDFATQGNRPPRYKLDAPIVPGPLRPVLLTGLKPKDGATALPLDPAKPDERLIGVEWRVGRGRVTMIAFNPIDPAFVAWKGMDNFIRRVVFRRPEEQPTTGPTNNKFWEFLSAPELSWVRFLGRDLGVGQSSGPVDPGDLAFPTTPLAAWNDGASELPVKVRKALEDASGISIPASSFVLKVVLAYVLALVPLNYLICRFLLRRRELAWAFVPVLAFGFAVVVERAAAYDLGFDSACDEVDLLEIQGGYRHAHLSRIAAMYSTGRDRYTISYPDDPSALALPLNMGEGRYLRAQENEQSVWQSSPEPALVEFQVQPRSLAMFRAEAMVNLGGSIGLFDKDDKGPRRVVNATNLELRDAVLVEGDGKSRTQTRLGTLLPGASVPIQERPETERDAQRRVGWVDTEAFLQRLREFSFGRPEDRGEVRLVAWAPDPHPGQVLTPKVDRHRGFRLVVAHLRYGPPPDPSGHDYYNFHKNRFRSAETGTAPAPPPDLNPAAPGAPAAPRPIAPRRNPGRGRMGVAPR